MPDPIADVTPVVEEVATEPVIAESVAEPTPHPLEPGGARFSEVYADMQDARREAARLQQELDRQRSQPQPQPQAQQPFYTPQQLQAYVDNGQITPAVMTAQIAWQERQIAKQEMRQEFSQAEQLKEAGTEVSKYIDAIPKLLDKTSQEYVKVDRENRRIAQRMGLWPDDPRVQQLALQVTFGQLGTINKARVNTEATRAHADTYVETVSGGGKLSTSKADPLKDIPASYKLHWERLGYTPAQMAEEAKYIKPTPRQRAGLWKP